MSMEYGPLFLGQSLAIKINNKHANNTYDFMLRVSEPHHLNSLSTHEPVHLFNASS
jgi:hypothetical protein